MFIHKNFIPALLKSCSLQRGSSQIKYERREKLRRVHEACCKSEIIVVKEKCRSLRPIVVSLYLRWWPFVGQRNTQRENLLRNVFNWHLELFKRIEGHWLTSCHCHRVLGVKLSCLCSPNGDCGVKFCCPSVQYVPALLNKWWKAKVVCRCEVLALCKNITPPEEDISLLDRWRPQLQSIIAILINIHNKDFRMWTVSSVFLLLPTMVAEADGSCLPLLAVLKAGADSNRLPVDTKESQVKAASNQDVYRESCVIQPVAARHLVVLIASPAVRVSSPTIQSVITQPDAQVEVLCQPRPDFETRIAQLIALLHGAFNWASVSLSNSFMNVLKLLFGSDKLTSAWEVNEIVLVTAGAASFNGHPDCHPNPQTCWCERFFYFYTE